MRENRSLTEHDLRRLTGLPLFVVKPDQLPYPPTTGHDPTVRELKSNAVALHKVVNERIRHEGIGHDLRRFKPADYYRMLEENTRPICLWITTNARPDSAESGPYSDLHSPLRMRGEFKTRGAVLLTASRQSARTQLQAQLHYPHELVENTWPQHRTAFSNLALLHEATHALQGASRKHDLFRHATEEKFWYELDADLGALRMGKQIGISAEARSLMTDARMVMAFNSTAKQYWFTPQINGINASFADTMAAQREIRATTLLALDRRPLPKADVMRRWAQGHDGERMLCKDTDVLNLRRSFTRLAEKLEGRDDIVREDLQALAYLDKHHEFLLPLAQQTAALTIKAARSFMPGIVGA